MKHLKQHALTLGDAIATVARYARDDHEVAVVVADFIRRGIIRFPIRRHHNAHHNITRRAA
ncbi:MAG: hypothetical protein WCG79_00515 [Verrucomicrobiota bacterium]|jgi:hypothetical protein